MRFFVPPIGTRIRLSKNWCFTLHREAKNVSLFHLAGWDKDSVYSSVDSMRSVNVESLPAGYPISLDYGEDVVPESVRAFWKRELRLPNSVINHPVEVFHVEASKIVIVEKPPEGAFTVWSLANLAGGSEKTVSLPESSVIEIENYSIKKNVEERDKIALKTSVDGKVESFWCDLEDFNSIEFDFMPEDQPWWWGIADRLEALENGIVVEPGVSFPDQGPGKTVVSIDSFKCETVDDIPHDARWLVYREGNRVAFWRVSNSQVEGSKWIEGHRGKSRGYPYTIEASKIIGKIAAYL